MENVGQKYLRLLEGFRLVAVPLILGEDRIGTITLYRGAERHPFRPKDGVFLQHLAYKIAACLSAERELQRQRQRQAKLARFVQNISNATSEEEACHLLVDFLHKEIHYANDDNAKVVLRLLEAGKSTIIQACYKGLQPIGFDPIKNIYQPGTVNVYVIRTRETKYYHDRSEKLRDGYYLFTHPHTEASLTIPLLAANICLGTVNLEHRIPSYYSQADIEFVGAVVKLTAQTLMRLKTQRFLDGLLDLVNDLVAPNLLPEELLSRAFVLLHDFTGYARLLYLIPGDNNSDDNPWVVERVIGDDGKPLSKEEIQDWRSHITELWPRSFLRKSLVQCNITHTNNVEDIASDKSLGIQTKAIEVVHLRRHSDKAITGMIALLMLLPNAVNKSQRKQLRTFSHFIGALIETQGNIKDLLDEKRLAEQEAVLGQALGQFRHTLRNRFSLLTNALGEAERRGVEGEWLQRAWRVLKDIDNDIDHARNLVKIPEFRDFDVVDVWNQVVARFSPRAQNKRIELSELAPSESVFFNSDPDIVALILENLVMNAIE